MNPVIDEDGGEIFLSSPYELYELLIRVNPKLYDV